MKNKSNDPSSPTPPKAPVNSSQTVQLPEPSSCKAEAAFGAAPLLGDLVAQLKLVHFIYLHGLRDDLEDYLFKIRGI